MYIVSGSDRISLRSVCSDVSEDFSTVMTLTGIGGRSEQSACSGCLASEPGINDKKCSGNSGSLTMRLKDGIYECSGAGVKSSFSIMASSSV